MADVKWIKLSVNIFDNRKIKIIRSLPDGDSLVLLWIQLLCLAGSVNDCGRLYITKEIPYTEDIIASLFGFPLNTVRFALEIFQRYGMIETVDDVLCISNWEKYQNIDGMERIREQNRIRKQKQRQQQKLLPPADMSRDSHVTVTQSHATDIERRKKNKKEDIEEDVVVFSSPTLEDVRSYAAAISSLVDADKFFDYYSANGWKIGSNPIKDWKAVFRNWSRNEPQRNQSSNPKAARLNETIERIARLND